MISTTFQMHFKNGQVAPIGGPSRLSEMSAGLGVKRVADLVNEDLRELCLDVQRMMKFDNPPQISPGYSHDLNPEPGIVALGDTELCLQKRGQATLHYDEREVDPFKTVKSYEFRFADKVLTTFDGETFRTSERVDHPAYGVCDYVHPGYEVRISGDLAYITWGL